MNVADIIDRFMTGNYTVTRRAAATFTNGRAQASATTTLTIEASVQRPKGRDLMRLPELRRTVETRVVYTTTQLLVGGQGEGNEADLVSIDGQSWEVEHVETWHHPQDSTQTFYRCIVQLT